MSQDWVFDPLAPDTIDLGSPNAPIPMPAPRFGPDGDVRTPTRRRFEQENRRGEVSLALGLAGMGAAGGAFLGPIGSLVGGAAGLAAGGVMTVLNRDQRHTQPLPGELEELTRGARIPSDARVATRTGDVLSAAQASDRQRMLDDLARRMEAENQPNYLGIHPDMDTALYGPAKLYTDLDPANQLTRMPPERRAMIQDKLAKLGLLDQSLATGDINSATIDALTVVMSEANLNARSWSHQLDRMLEHAEAARRTSAEEQWQQARAGFVRDAFLAPSYETMAQTVKDEFRRQLGRDPKDYEIELLSEELSASARAAHDQLQDVREAEYLAQAAASIEAATGESVGSTTVQTSHDQMVDPVAAFREKFEELYKPEIDAERAEEDHQNTTRRLISGLSAIDGMMS